MLGLSLLALIAGLLMAWFVTERIPHTEDEAAYLFQARVFARGQLWGPPEPAASAYFIPFVLTIEDHRVGKYPIGWPLVLALGELFQAGWVINPILNALIVMIIYGLARDLYDRQAGIIAALLAVASPFALIQSGSLLSHQAAAFWLAVLAWAMFNFDQARERRQAIARWSALMGAALGMMAITRPYTAMAASLPFLIALAVQALKRPLGLRALLAAYGPMVAIAGLLTLLQPLWLYLISGDPFINLYTKIWAYDRVGFGPDFGRSGHTLSEGLTATRRVLREGWLHDLFGWRYLSWLPVLAGVVFGVQRAKPSQRHWSLIFAASFVSLVAFHVAYWINRSKLGPRYYYEAHAGLMILGGVGVQALARTLAKVLGARLGSQQVNALVYGITLVLISFNLMFYLPQRLGDWQAYYGITRGPIDRLLELTGEQPVLVIVKGERWPDYAALLSLNSPFYDGHIITIHDWNLGYVQSLIEAHPERRVWYYSSGEFSILGLTQQASF